MMLAQIVIDYTININTPLIIGAFIALYGAIKKYWNKIYKVHDIQRMKFESMLYANYLRMNGDAEKWKKDYEKHLSELMKEKKYIES